MQRRALGSDHPDTADPRRMIGWVVRFELGGYAENGR
jgi:hypothetical protein